MVVRPSYRCALLSNMWTRHWRDPAEHHYCKCLLLWLLRLLHHHLRHPVLQHRHCDHPRGDHRSDQRQCFDWVIPLCDPYHRPKQLHQWLHPTTGLRVFGLWVQHCLLPSPGSRRCLQPSQVTRSLLHRRRQAMLGHYSDCSHTLRLLFYVLLEPFCVAYASARGIWQQRQGEPQQQQVRQQLRQ